MVITTIADGVTRGIESVSDTISETLFEPVIRLGVTGLARSGKTVFITSLVANLMDRARMPGLIAAGDGRIEAAFCSRSPTIRCPASIMKRIWQLSQHRRLIGLTVHAQFRNCACRYGFAPVGFWAVCVARRPCIWTSLTIR